LTNGKDKDEVERKGAPAKPARPDPRLVAFVRMLGRRAAEQDYARLLKTHGRGPEPLLRKE